MPLEIYEPLNLIKSEEEQRFLMNDFFIEEYNLNMKGLTILLYKRSTKRREKVIVQFISPIIPRISEETYDPIPNRGAIEVYDLIYKVHNSEYMYSLEGYTDVLSNGFCFEHYHMRDENFIFDIAGQYSPDVSVFKDDQLIEKIESKWHQGIKLEKEKLAKKSGLAKNDT